MPPRIYPRQIRNQEVDEFIRGYNTTVNKPPIPANLLPTIQNNYVFNFRTKNYNKYTAQTMQKLKPTEVVVNRDNQATIFDVSKNFTYTLQVEIAFRHISNENYTQTLNFEIQINSLDKTLVDVRQAILNFNRILVNRNTNPVLWDSIIEQAEEEPDYPNEDWVIEHIYFDIRGNNSIIANTQTLPNNEVIPYLPERRNIQNVFQDLKNRFQLFKEIYKYMDPRFDYEKIPELSNGDGYCIGHLVKSVNNSNKLMDKQGYTITELEEYCSRTDTELKIYNPNLKLIYTFDITNPKNKRVRKLNFIYTSKHCYAIDTDVLMKNRYKDFVSDVKTISDKVIHISKPKKEKKVYNDDGASIKYIYDDDISEVLKEYENFKNGITTKITFKYKYDYRDIVEKILNEIEKKYKDRPIIKKSSLDRILKIEYKIKVKLTKQEINDKVKPIYNTFKITTPEHFVNKRGKPLCKENTKPVYNLSIAKMYESIDKIKEIATSNFHKTVYDLFNYQYNTIFRCLQRDGLTEEELKEQHQYSLDIISSHKNALLDLEGDIPIFNEVDRFVRFDPKEDININDWYIVEVYVYDGEFRFPFKNTQTHWDGESLKYLILNGFVGLYEVKYVLKPSKLCRISKIQYIYLNFINNIKIDTTLSIDDQKKQRKFNENMFIGLIGKGSEIIENSFYTDFSDEELNLYRQTTGYKAFHKNDKDRLLITNHYKSEFLHNLTPLYQKIRNKEVVNICEAYKNILNSGGIPFNIVADEIVFYHPSIEKLSLDKSKYKLEVNKIVYTAKPEKAEFRSKMKWYPTKENELDQNLHINSYAEYYVESYTDPEYIELKELMNKNFHILDKNKTIDKINKKFKINKCIVKNYIPFLGFIRGNPGSGKTYFITKLLRNLYYLPSNIKILKLAFTNKTAQQNKTINMDAFTFHSLFSISDSGNENTKKLNIYDIILIEEISMVPREFLKYLYEAKHLGKSIIILGDFNQLPPIKERGELKSICLDDILPIVDNNIYELLYSHRFSNETLEKINSYCKDLDLMKKELPKHKGNLLRGLCYLNETRKNINSKSNKLFLELNKPEITLDIYGIENDKNYEFTQNITICKDIPLFAYKTNKKLNIYNGLSYKVSNIDLENEIISVKEDETDEIIEVSLINFRKIFVLGFGISLYKTQGETLDGDYYITDLTFMNEKVKNSIYVAISRCNNINNIYLEY